MGLCRDVFGVGADLDFALWTLHLQLICCTLVAHLKTVNECIALKAEFGQITGQKATCHFNLPD
jgi:hypothetical protein